MTIMEPKGHEFMPKKPLEEVLIHLRNGSLNFVDQSQPPIPVVNEKFKGKGKQTRNLQESCDVDFKNKRSGQILSRIIRNKHKQRDDYVPTIIIEDLNSVESVSPNSAGHSHPRYDFVSILPLFLHKCEGFTGIQTNLKARMVQEKSPDSDHKQPLPNMELVCCYACLAWIQRYYIDIPYLRMHLNQTLMQNRDLERENWDLRFEL